MELYGILTGPIPWKLHFTFGLQQVGGQIPSPHMLGVSFCPHIIGKTFASISVPEKQFSG